MSSRPVQFLATMKISVHSFIVIMFSFVECLTSLVIMGEEKNNNVHCWEARTGELHRPLKSSKSLVCCSVKVEWLETKLKCQGAPLAIMMSA